MGIYQKNVFYIIYYIILKEKIYLKLTHGPPNTILSILDFLEVNGTPFKNPYNLDIILTKKFNNIDYLWNHNILAFIQFIKFYF